MSEQKNKLNRREFMSRSIGGVVAASMIAPTILPRSIFGANDRINLAVIGIRGQGGGHIHGFSDLPNVRVHTICDCDENLFSARMREVEEKHGYKPKTRWDLRKVLDDKDIDAVTIAMPNHWHALATIWACQAGKHVYVEKPSCHSIWEGRKMVEAADKYKVLVQVGFQNRSRKRTMAAMKFLHDGKLGEIYMVRGLCFKPRWDIGSYPDGPMQEGETFTLRTDGSGKMPAYTKSYLEKVHYDNWIGPAKERPFNRNRFHYNWHWQWEYGNGDTGNQGPHQFDIAHWGLNKKEYPLKVYSKGGYYLFDSDQNTPNTQTSVFEYADGVQFEFATRGLFTHSEGAQKIGVIFYGREGWLEIDADGNWETYFGYNGKPGPSSKQLEEQEKQALQEVSAGAPSASEQKEKKKATELNTVGTGTGGHYGNFIQAVRSGKKSDLNCPIEVGHQTSVLPHMANISYRIGRELLFDGSKEQFVDDDEANNLLQREIYRAPYIVPDTV
jgi:predicted dehydrogenase